MDLNSARLACAKQTGNVTLADLHDTFNEVKDYIAGNFPYRRFWVNAQWRQYAVPYGWWNGYPVHYVTWSNGYPVDLNMWWTAVGEPTTGGYFAYIGQGGLRLRISGLEQSFFICRGKPAFPPTGMQVQSIFTTTCTGSTLQTPNCNPSPAFEKTTRSVQLTSTDNPNTSSMGLTSAKNTPGNTYSRESTTVTGTTTQGTSTPTVQEATPVTGTTTPTDVIPAKDSTETFTDKQPTSTDTGITQPDSKTTDQLKTTRGLSTAETRAPPAADVTSTSSTTEGLSTRYTESTQAFSATTNTSLDHPRCCCPSAGNVTVNVTVLELQEKVETIKKALTLNKSKLSATIQKKTCASDPRASSRNIGVLGIALLVLVFGTIVLLDLSRLALTLFGLGQSVSPLTP